MRTNQSAAAIGRQILALLGVVFGVLTQSVSAMHLPVAVSTALTLGGSVILAVEHFVADPSTGGATPPFPVQPPTPVAAPPAPPSVVH